MALKTRGIVTQVKKETTFNTAPVFADSDVVVSEKVTVTPKVDMVDRKNLGCSIVSEAGIPVRFTTTGDMSFELETNGSGDLQGAVLYEAGFGYKLANGATIDEANHKIVYKSDASGDAVIYRVASGDIARISLAIKKYFDSGDVVLQSLGNVVNKVELDFKQADILMASFGLEGSSYATMTGQTKPACTADSGVPFVGKNATFTYDGASVCAKDIKITIDNSITNSECITSEGYGDKDIVEKKISGSFTCLLEDFSYLDKLTNQTVGKLFTDIKVGTKEVAVYLPRIKVSDVSVNDDSNKLIDVTVNFTAEFDTTANDVMMLAVKE